MKKENLWKKTLSYALAISFVAQSAVSGTQFTKISAEPDDPSQGTQNNAAAELAAAKETLKSQIELLKNSTAFINYCKGKANTTDEEFAKAIVDELKNSIDDLTADEFAELQTEIVAVSTNPASVATATALNDNNEPASKNPFLFIKSTSVLHILKR